MTARRPNYVGILAGAIVMFAFGAIWFTVFGAAWVAAIGQTKQQLVAAGYLPYVVSFVAGLLVSYCFDNMLWHYEKADAMKGAQIGVLTGVCIYGAMLANLFSFEMRPSALFLIDAGYGIIGFVLAGATVGALRGRATRAASPAA